MSEAEYLSKSKEGTVSLISRYYIEMSNGEDCLFFCLRFGSVFWVELWFLTLFFLFVTANSTLEIPKKANMLYLSTEETSKYQKLKMQILLSTDSESKNTEYVWKCNGFFGAQKGKLHFLSDFPKNTLI